MRLTFTLPLLVALTSTSAMASPADDAIAHLSDESPRARVERHPGRDLPTGLANLRSGPWPGEPEAAARAFLRAHRALVGCPIEELSARMVIPAGAPGRRGYGRAGAVVRFAQWHDGVPSAWDSAIVVLDERGVVRALRQRCQRAEGAATPSLNTEEAIFAAQRALPLTRPGAQLVWYGHQEVARLAWRVRGNAGPALGVQEIYVDAHSGAIREIRSLTESAQARIFGSNPVVEPQTMLVELPEIDPEEVGDYLAGPRGKVYRHEDRGELVTIYDIDGNPIRAHTTTVLPFSGINGDFEFEPIPYPADPARDEDSFSGPNIYYNSLRAKDYFASLGLGAMASEPYSMHVNLRSFNTESLEILSDPEAPLATYNNAYYSSGYQSGSSYIPSTLAFGQGSVSDFAYDSDVVIHEQGHGFVDTVQGPRGAFLDEYGLSVEPSALNEAVADYFSAVMQADPILAEYAGLAYNPDGGGIRDMITPFVCPDDVIGQSHNDGRVYSSALWAIREQLTHAEQLQMDLAIFLTVAGLPYYSSISEAAYETIDRIEQLLGAEIANIATEVLETHGALGCERLKPIAAQDINEPILSMGLPSAGAIGGEGTMASYLQFKTTHPGGPWSVTVRFYQITFTGVQSYWLGTVRELQPVGIVANLGAPITWDFQMTDDGTAISHSGELVAEAAPSASLPTVQSGLYVFHPYEATWELSGPGGDYYLQLANIGDGSTSAYDVSVELKKVLPAYDGNDDDDDDVETGCAGGCGPSGRAGGLFMLLGAGALGRRRKR